MLFYCTSNHCVDRIVSTLCFLLQRDIIESKDEIERARRAERTYCPNILLFPSLSISLICRQYSQKTAKDIDAVGDEAHRAEDERERERERESGKGEQNFLLSLNCARDNDFLLLVFFSIAFLVSQC
jgi:hypothetical protein